MLTLSVIYSIKKNLPNSEINPIAQQNALKLPYVFAGETISVL